MGFGGLGWGEGGAMPIQRWMMGCSYTLSGLHTESTACMSNIRTKEAGGGGQGKREGVRDREKGEQYIGKEKRGGEKNTERENM
jgi:hypothetical protein